MRIRVVGVAVGGAVALCAGLVAGAPAAFADSPAGWPGAPDGGWVHCADGADQYCIESATLDGNPAGATVNVLVGTPESFNWAIDGPTAAGQAVSIVVRVGTFTPLYTTSYAKDLNISNSTTDGNTTMTITGETAAVNWSFAGGFSCSPGSCGDDTTHATYDGFAFMGGTQNMSTWGDEAINTYGGMYIATNAQYRPTTVNYWNTPIVPDTDPVWHWEVSVANPHLLKDSDTQATGSFTAYIPPRYFVGKDFSAADTEFEVTRIDGGSHSTVSGTTTRDEAGGTKLTIPNLSYSSPTLAMRLVPRSDPPAPASKPGLPRALKAVGSGGRRTVSWLAPTSDGGAAISGYRATVLRKYDVKKKIKRKGKKVTVTIHKSATYVRTTAARSLGLTGIASGRYTVSVSARNSAGLGRAAVVAFRG